jgi:hypothetical protein
VRDVPFDYVVTVCDHAHQRCPVFPGRTRVVHAGFDDPPRMAREAEAEEEALHHYHRVRDEIRAFVEKLPGGAGIKRPITEREMSATRDPNDAQVVREKVRAGYAEVAHRQELSAASDAGCCGSAGASPSPRGSGQSCCGPGGGSADALAEKFGYDAAELATLPEGANMGLSCGNPTGLASLQPGEVVLDLGSGGGFDCFLAGPRVGPTGHVIGVDMTPEMLSKARHNVLPYRERTEGREK